MSDARLQIVIDALNKASGDLGKLKNDIAGVDDSAKKAEGSTKGFGSQLKNIMGTATAVAAGVAAVGVALKKVYETGREGAELLYVEDRFNNLTEAAGITADVLMNDLREATRGLKSDSELMGGATDFMALGLAKTHDEVVRLTSVAGALGMNMNQLVLTLTNQTTMRFDALGVSVDGFDEKVKALTESGMDANEAFTEAFLQQAEEQIEKVGHAADSTKGAFDRLAAGVKTNMDNMKKDTARAIEPIIEYMAELVEGNNSFVNVKHKLEELNETNQIAAEDFGRLWQQLNYTATGVEDVAHWLDLYEGAADRAATTSASYYDYVVLVDDASGDLADSTKDLETATRDVDAAMKSYNDTLLFTIARQGLSDEAAYALAESMGLVDQKTAYARQKTEEWRTTLDYAGEDADLYAALIRGLAEDLENLPDDVPINVNMIMTNTGEVDRYLASLQRQITIPVTYQIQGDIPQIEATGGQVFKSRPAGGPTSSSNPYLWQEYGYRGEVFVPGQNGYVLSRADAKRVVSEAMNDGGKGGNTYNYNLTMPTSSNPADIGMAFELMRSYGGMQ